MLWKWAEAKMPQLNLFKVQTQKDLYKNSYQQLDIVNSNRIKIIEDICLIETHEIKSQMKKILERIEQLDNLKTMELCIASVQSEANPKIVARIVSKMKNFTLCKSGQRPPGEEHLLFPTNLRRNAGVDENLLPAILREIASNVDCKTELLNINVQGGYILTHVDPDLIGMAAAKLSAIETCDTGLTSAQATRLFEAIAESKGKFGKLKLNNEEKLFSVRPKLLSEAVKQLKELNLTGPCFTDKQKSKIFQAMQDDKIDLRKLSLSCEHIGDLLR